MTEPVSRSAYTSTLLQNDLDCVCRYRAAALDEHYALRAAGELSRERLLDPVGGTISSRVDVDAACSATASAVDDSRLHRHGAVDSGLSRDALNDGVGGEIPR